MQPSGIAVIGLAGRWPGARNPRELWRNLRDGVEAVSFFTDRELLDTGVDPSLVEDPSYVKAASLLEGVDLFDAGLFGYSPREAETMDPQHRLFLECAWEALESAGYDSTRFPGRIGVFAGISINNYVHHLLSHAEVRRSLGGSQLVVGNDKDYLTTRVSYKLDLRGPSVAVQTACSTSLVAVHLACRSLLDGECDMALAGGVSISQFRKGGYLYRGEATSSPDGHCRAFDAQARGTLNGNGVAIVVLRRFDEARDARDHIHARIRGSAINNDGAHKVGFVAPSIEGQAAVIAAALEAARVTPDDISYVEAHGTGTVLGDPIEIKALTRAYRTHTARRGFCAIGSIKSNLGHMDTAAGASGLIKTTLALAHRQLPPTLHVTHPNPHCEFEDSPFVVNTTLRPWAANGHPRLAGVSSFGIGGTNAHVIVEEAASRPASGPSRPWQVLSLSARTPEALDAATAQLAQHLDEQPESLPDVAYTLHVGRRTMAERRIAICRDAADARDVLRGADPRRVLSAAAPSDRMAVAFLFPGQGAQTPGMGEWLYQHEPLARRLLDRAAEVLGPSLGLDLRRVLFPPASAVHSAARQLEQTYLAQPALFAIEYAIARQWMAWGVTPDALLGHSIGEYVAACLAGVLSFEDALTVVAARGRLMQSMPRGAMLAVCASEAQIREGLPSALSIAAVNGPRMVVVSGDEGAIAAFARRVASRGLSATRLHVSHAFHSATMDPVLPEFEAILAGVPLAPPRMRMLSNLTGTWLRAEEATSPRYWASHLRETVRFADGVATLLRDPSLGMLEVGPGHALTRLVRVQAGRAAGTLLVCSLASDHTGAPHPPVLEALGRLWVAGVPIQWEAYYADEQRHRVPLPCYPFERERYWIDRKSGAARASDTLARRADVANWFYTVGWRRACHAASPNGAEDRRRWLVFGDRDAVTDAIVGQIATDGRDVLRVAAGATFARREHDCEIDPRTEADYVRLMRECVPVSDGARIVFLADCFACSMEGVAGGVASAGLTDVERFMALLFVPRALAAAYVTAPIDLSIVTRGAYDVESGDESSPEQAMLTGALRVIQQEHTNLACRAIDLTGLRTQSPTSASAAPLDGQGVHRFCEVLRARVGDRTIAIRGRHAWVPQFESVRLGRPPALDAGLRARGVYLIIGGIGPLGLCVNEFLAERVQARLALVARTPLPPRHLWDAAITDGTTDARVRDILTRLRDIEQRGSEVLVLRSDAADTAAMTEALATVRGRFGAPHGVIYAAGAGPHAARQAVVETASTHIEAQLRVKARAVEVLERVLADTPLDFCVLFSSLSNVLGGLGFSTYAAANAWLDAFVLRHNRYHTVPWTVIDWDGWSLRRRGEHEAVSGRELAMPVEQGIDAFQRILATRPAEQIVVSTGDLQERLRRWVERPSVIAPKADGSLPSHTRPRLRTTFVEPETLLQRELASMWTSLLGVSGIGLDDNFFELGGHSLLATQLFSRVRDSLHVMLPLRTVFEASTIRALAACIEKARVEPVSPELAPIQPRPPSDEAPLTYAQQRLWFLDQLQPGNPAYHVNLSLRIHGALDVGVLERTFAEVIRRHDILRTTFHQHPDGPFQRIVPPGSVVLPVIDWAALDAEFREPELRALGVMHARRPFSLEQGPLVRFALVHLEDHDHALLVTMHHIISDEWSMGVAFGEMAAIYGAFRDGKPSPLPELALQYADLAYWQQVTMAGLKLDEQLAYWRRTLAGAPPVLPLAPADRRRSLRLAEGATLGLEVGSERPEALKALGRANDATLFMVLLAALQALLAWRTNTDDIVVGTDIANRNRIETEPMIGFLVNQLVLRTHVDGDSTFLELLARVRDVTLGAYACQDVPFDRLVEVLNPERSVLWSPLFQVKLVLLNASPPRPMIGGLRLAAFGGDTRTAKYDLMITVREDRPSLAVLFEYNVALFDEQMIRGFIRDYDNLLRVIVERPGAPLHEMRAELERLGSAARQETAAELAQQHLGRLRMARRKAVAL